MGIPEWANPDISNLLPKIRAGGEGQAYEFKEDFPESHKLAKSAAAMATAGGGLILIGVRNDGTVAGLGEADSDKLYHRAQSIIEQVQPAVEHRISVCFDEGVILAICIHLNQSKPVFYSDGRPYIRVGRTSRRASPDEVQAAVWSHSSSEHKRKLEELDYQRRAKHQERMGRLSDSVHQTNDMVRRGFTPK